MSLPSLIVEVAWSTAPDDPAPAWVDVSDYVVGEDAVEITRGRTDELTDPQPSTLNLALDNTDGRFTPGNTASPYYPHVRLLRRVRVTATLPDASTVTRFDGWVTDLAVSWPGGADTEAVTQLSASSRFARMAAQGSLLSVVEHEVLPDEPDLYYLLNEGSEATRAESTSRRRREALTVQGSGGEVTFGGSTGPGTDGYTAPTFAGGKYLRRVLPSLLDATTPGFMIECALVCTEPAGGGRTRGAVCVDGPTVDNTGFSAYLGVAGDGFGNALIAEVWWRFGDHTLILTSPESIRDGEVHHAALVVTGTSSSLHAELYLDGVLRATGDSTGGRGMEPARRLTVGDGPATSAIDPWVGSIAHVGIWAGNPLPAAARIFAHGAAMLDGFAGDTVAERLERLARYGGYDPTIVTAADEGPDLDNQQTDGKTPLELMRDAVRSDGGVLLDGRDGELVYQARASRYGAAPAVTLSAADQQVGADLAPTLDDQRVENEHALTSTALNTTTVAVNTDSQDEYGPRRVEGTTWVQVTGDTDATAALVQDAADARVNLYGQPAPRVAAVTVDVVNLDDATVAALLTLELGDRVDVVDLLAAAGDPEQRFYVEGYTERATSSTYTLTLNLSPAALSEVWVLEHPTYGALDTYPLAY